MLFTHTAIKSALVLISLLSITTARPSPSGFNPSPSLAVLGKRSPNHFVDFFKGLGAALTGDRSLASDSTASGIGQTIGGLVNAGTGGLAGTVVGGIHGLVPKKTESTNAKPGKMGKKGKQGRHRL